MAITKIWTVKSRLDTSLNYITDSQKTILKPNMDAVEGIIKYIENKDKTENCVYVRAYNCSKENAFDTMIETQDYYGKSRRKNGVLAYHLVQSFKDFETTPEIAHQCGLELAERLFADKYEVVIATHLDHKHLHNHILINSVSFVDGSKYRNNFKDYFIDIRGISDEICREKCLSVIEHPKGKGLHYAEWKALKEGKPTIRGQMREELDEIIKASYTMKDFWRILEQRQYVIHRRGETIKHTSMIPSFGKRAVRLDNLGKGYSEQDIFERIKTNRNGIRTAAPTELSQKQYTIKGSLAHAKRKKLKGFQALYFRYLYLFKKIRRKQTPQRVSFFMREELIKLERYQRQFKFLVANNIETGAALSSLQQTKEDEMKRLVQHRKQLYEERTDENCEEIKEKTNEINAELSALRCEVRLCKAIFKDAYRISEKKRQADELQKQADKERIEYEHKRRSR
ncbi:relaxase/mobilization nuclease domain-containing protein [Ructibacterium gallinarum]|uniref:Relaxase/mobilization nuclease domain-containing protein n=1 Tax=Ructibacterium gallinarum TaxID=2779355 RepID=A0A9D5M7Y1_9FIRM|nr:relaxase/mobilization nuclease domain-containing protein [Ructibacterium gallinarum]MBE5041207.1 relaxase/mobilization nuclease domain-containing protein [Ructibacterium gallinarum]